MPSPDPLQPHSNCGDNRLAALPTPVLLAGARAALQDQQPHVAQDQLRAAVGQAETSPFLIAFAAYLSTQAQVQDPAVCPHDACQWTSTLLTKLQGQTNTRSDDAELVALSVQYWQGDWSARVLERFHLRLTLLLHRAALVHPETAEVLQVLLLPRFRARKLTQLTATTLEVIQQLRPRGGGAGGGMFHSRGPGPLFDLHP